MAVLIGAAFLRIGTGQSSTLRRQPLLYFWQASFVPRACVLEHRRRRACL